MSTYFILEHRDKLIQSALSDENIAALRWSTGTSDRLLITYLKPDGSPELRHDGKPFLRWRTSDQWRAQQQRNGQSKPPKYLSPKGQGCRLYHSHLAIQQGGYEERLKDRFTSLRITEGELKVEAAAVHDPQRVTIGLGGVNSWRDRYDGGEESRPLVDFEEIPLQGREVHLCFDSDLDKPQVVHALRGLAEFLVGQGSSVWVEVLPHGLDGERLGLDDLIYRHGPALLHRIAGIARDPFKLTNGGVPQWRFSAEPTDTHQRNTYLSGMLGPLWRRSTDANDHWQRWNGRHWEEVTGDDDLTAAIENFAELQGWRNRELNTIRSLKAAFRRTITPVTEQASTGLIPFRNGALSLADMRLVPHDLAHGNTWCLPYSYDPDASCNSIEDLLADRLEAAESVALFRAFARSLLTCEHPKAFLEITGPGNTGKSVLANLLIALVGSGNAAACTLQRIEDRAQRFETLKLRGQRLAVFSECQDYSGQLQVLKAITGRDPIGAEIKGGRHLNFTFHGGVVLVANGPIRASDPSGAVINRRRSLRVTKVVPASAERTLIEPDEQGGWRGELVAQLPGFVNWALAMPADQARLALARDARSIARVEAELAALLETDLLAAWADERLAWEPGTCLRVGTASNDPGEFLYPAYVKFTDENSRMSRPLSCKVFKCKLVDLIRDTLGLPLPAGDISKDPYRIREVGSVVPYLRWRTADDENGVIRHAFLARIQPAETPTDLTTPGTDAEQVRDGKTPAGNGWNGRNESERDSVMREEHPAEFFLYRAMDSSESVPAVPSVPQKGSQGSASVSHTPFPVPLAVACAVGTEPTLGPEALTSIPLLRNHNPRGASGSTGLDERSTATPAMSTRAELAANAARSNLTLFRPGDQIRIAHPLLPYGRLHQGVVSGAVNASIHFEPPLEGLLKDPGDPDVGQWEPPAPIDTAGQHHCLPELGVSAAAVIEHVEREGQLIRRLSYSQPHPDGSQSTVTREIPVPEAGWQPLDDNGLDVFLVEIEKQNVAVAAGLQNYRFREAG